MIKVADFGLSEDIYARNYFRRRKSGESGEAPVKLPIKWMAVESLNDELFSEKTDVVRILRKYFLTAVTMCVGICSGHLESLVGRCSQQGGILILELTSSHSSDTWTEERD